jgi:hypothetical protein
MRRHVYGNIIARAELGGVHIHGGRDNVIENNIMVGGARQQMTYTGYNEKEPHFPTMTKSIRKPWLILRTRNIPNW